MQRALGASLLLHVIVLAFFAIQLPTFKKPEDDVISVRLIAAPPPPRTQPKKAHKKPSKPPKPVRTQASAAPKEPPNPKKQATTADPDRMKVAAQEKPKKIEKPKAQVKELAKETKKAEETAQKRPPKLDKTPDKKIVQSTHEEAKTVTDPDDFLAALEFIDQLAKNVEPSAPTPETTPETVVDYSIADLAEIDGIKRHIENNWLRPPGLKAEDLTAIVVVKLNADGTVKSTKIEQSSGEVFYDNSLIRAINKASPLPIPAAKYEKFSVLELYFKG